MVNRQLRQWKDMEDVQGLVGIATFDSRRQKLASTAWLGVETRLCHGNAIC